MQRHLMIDLETLGVNPGCVVLSIGAVEFNSQGLISTFSANIDIGDSMNHGLKVEPRTLMWWMDQSEEARKRAFANGRDLNSVLVAFTQAFNWTDLKVWCNGASFDFPILKAIYETAEFRTPWMYYNEMDFRTFKNLYKPLYEEVRVKPTVAHDGLEDAYAQVKTLQNMFNAMEDRHVRLAA